MDRFATADGHDRRSIWVVPAAIAAVVLITTKPHHLEENITATDVQLTVEDLDDITGAQFQAQGSRYSKANEQLIDR